MRRAGGRTYEWVLNCDLVPRTVRRSRWRSVHILVVSLLLMGWCVYLGRDLRLRPLVLVLTPLIFWVMPVVALAGILWPSEIHLDERGFSMHGSLGKSWFCEWRACGPFAAVKARRTSVVGWDGAVRMGSPRWAKLVHAECGLHGALPPGAGGLRAKYLWILMERYRQAYLQPTGIAEWAGPA
jgi:hypothetical protein